MLMIPATIVMMGIWVISTSSQYSKTTAKIHLPGGANSSDGLVIAGPA